MYNDQPLTETFAFRLSRKAKQRIQEVARRENRQPGSIIRVVVEQWLDELERHHEGGAMLLGSDKES